MEISNIIFVYENIYNQELLYRRDLDGKLLSRFTFLAMSITLLAVQSKWLFPSLEETASPNILGVILQAVMFAFAIGFLFQAICMFIICFFRAKKDYEEMPITEIRKWHLQIGQYKELHMWDNVHRFAKMLPEEERLLSYMKDSYIRCALSNRKTNSRRADALIKFDITCLISLLLALINYYIMYLKWEGLEWLFTI